MKQILVSHHDQVFAQDAARRFLEADDDTRDDIEAFFYSNGPEMLQQSAAKFHGIPTSEELRGWFGLS